LPHASAHAHAPYAGAGEAHVAHVTLAVGSVCTGSIQATIVPLHCRPQRPSLSPKNAIVCDQLHLSESNVSECVRLCDTHTTYTYGM